MMIRGPVARLAFVLFLVLTMLIPAAHYVVYRLRKTRIRQQMFAADASDYEDMCYSTSNIADGSVKTAARTFTVTDYVLKNIGYPISYENTTVLDNQSKFDWLVFVTATDRKHFGQCLDAISTVQRYFPRYQVYFYDLDDKTTSSEEEGEELLREHMSLVWIDPTVRFIHSASAEALRKQVMSSTSDLLMFQYQTRTISDTTFHTPLEYIPKSTLSTTTTVTSAKLTYIHFSRNVSIERTDLQAYDVQSASTLKCDKHRIISPPRVADSGLTLYRRVLRWWLFCALQPNCIDPDGDERCRGDDDVSCPFFDDVTLSVLLSNFYGGDISEYGSTDNNIVEASSVHYDKERLQRCPQNGNVNDVPVSRIAFIRKFHVVSNSTGLVLDIENGDVRPGTPVILYQKMNPPSANQQWFFDENGHIRSEKDKLTIQADVGKTATMEQFSGKTSQNWLAYNGKIVSRITGKCLQIDADKRHVTVNVCRKSASSQQWFIDYLP